MNLEEYLRDAVKEFRQIESREYDPENVDRDVRAVSRFVDLLFGKYRGKAGR
jgi:hypothetical protein